MRKKDGVQMILAMPYFDDLFSYPWDKIYLLLVYLKVKPCTLFVCAAPSLNNALFYYSLDFFCQKLNKLGLFYSLSTHPLGFIDFPYLTFWVAKDGKILKKALAAKTDKEIGLVLGFPKTAVKAYCEENGYTRVGWEIYPEKIKNHFILGYVMSRENWRKEIKTLEKWYRTIAKYAPRLLEEYKEYNRKTKIILGQPINRNSKKSKRKK